MKLHKERVISEDGDDGRLKPALISLDWNLLPFSRTSINQSINQVESVWARDDCQHHLRRWLSLHGISSSGPSKIDSRSVEKEEDGTKPRRASLSTSTNDVSWTQAASVTLLTWWLEPGFEDMRVNSEPNAITWGRSEGIWSSGEIEL
jgi:hypothetical protein